MMRTLALAALCLGLILCEARVQKLATTIDAVRLVDGLNNQSGRVEILAGGRWGAVCDDEFDDRAARVVCRMAGHPSNIARAIGRAAFGESNLTMLLDDVHCSGDEPDLNNCTHLPIGVNDCFRFEEVGVACGALLADKVRLVNDGKPQEGRLEVQLGDQWGTVCDDYFDGHAAQVVCRMLNFTTVNATPVSSGIFGRGGGLILLDNVRCTGNESSLADCENGHFGINDCSHAEDVGVICDGLRLENVTLVNGSHPQEGRLEIQVAGRWGTVCEEAYYSGTDIFAIALVACRMLNFPTENATVVSSDRFGPGDGLILMDNVVCTGEESSLEDCGHNGFSIHNCDHTEDVGVICA